MPWVRDKRSTDKIAPEDYETIRKRINAYAAMQPWGSRHQLQFRFRGQFCYVDNLEPDGSTAPLCRLRYCGDNLWSAGFYTYSQERYEPCILPQGSFEGSLEEAFSVCEMYLT